MLADALSKGRLNVPSLEGPIADELKSKLYPGAAVGNPIDIIGTGTPEHLATAIDFCENRFDNVDLMMVIFGSPGLVKLYDTYEVLHKKMEECKKPIFPILPSIVTAGGEELCQERPCELLGRGDIGYCPFTGDQYAETDEHGYPAIWRGCTGSSSYHRSVAG